MMKEIENFKNQPKLNEKYLRDQNEIHLIVEGLI